MPSIDSILESRKRKNKFQKKAYRAYDLSPKTEYEDIAIEEISTKNSFNDMYFKKKQDAHPEANAIQPDNNQITNAIQPDNNQITNAIQPDNNQITNAIQPDNNQITNVNNIGTKNDIDIHTKKQVTFNSFMTEKQSYENHYLSLSDLQKKIINTLSDICDARENNCTGPVNTKAFAEFLGTTYGSLKTTLKRLIDKNILNRGEGKSTPNGYMILYLQTNIIKASKELRNKINDFSKINNLDNNPDNKSLYSSNSNIITTKNDLNEDWKNIDYEPIKQIGFGLTQIKQLQDKNVPELVQESIYHFAFGLENSDYLSKQKDPLRVLMGVLRKGEQWCEPNYKSPKEIALQKLLEKKMLERKKEENLEQQIFEEDFKIWYQKLEIDSKDEILKSFKILPKVKKHITQNQIDEMFKGYYKNNIWQGIDG